MRRFTRFERKIAMAVGVAAVVPLVGSLVLGRMALRDTYEVGVNRQVENQLRQSLALYRGHFVALRERADRTVDAIARDHRLREALEEPGGAVKPVIATLARRYPDVAGLRVSRADGSSEWQWSRSSRRAHESQRLLTQERRLEDLPGRPTVSVTIATARAPFLEYEEAGEVASVYRRLRERADYLYGSYLAVYIALLLSVIVVAIAVGIVWARRVTRGVADLAIATTKVGSGDLDVRVPERGADEIGELTRAFNSMVADLRQSRDRIEYLRRVSAWQEFARRLAHEIKNPLTPIQLAVQELHRAYSGSDESFRRQVEDVRSIVEEEVATLRRLVGEFSAFARLPRAVLESADLSGFVADLDRAADPFRSEFQELSSSAPVEVRCDPGEEPLPVRIDAMMLRRCVVNLTRNAVQAMGVTGGQVIISSRRANKKAVLEVRDSGPGIPPSDRERIFDPYFTTRDDGTGLGLAIVKKVVLEHHAVIRCSESSLGGAAFAIELPLRPPERVTS